MPAKTIKAVASRTRKPLRADQRITPASRLALRRREGLQGGAQIALGIDQKVGAGDDLLAFAHAVEHRGVTAGAGAELHRARFIAPLAAIDQNGLPCAGVEHRGIRHR
jgi:hypothetical protein